MIICRDGVSSSAVNQTPAPRRALRHLAAVALAAAGAVAHANPASLTVPGGPGLTSAPEASFEQRIDPWSRWSLKLYAEPVPGDAAARGGMEARFLTRRFDAHQLQGGAALSFSPGEPGPVEAWQALDDRRSSVFIEDRFHWSSSLSLSAGARLVEAQDGAALHHRLALAWQPIGAWAVRATDGALQLPTAGAPWARRFRGLELETEQTAGPLRVRARAASHEVSDVVQSQILHAAALTLALPLHPQWSVGSQTVISNRGDLTRLQLAGSALRDRAKVSLAVPYRVQGRAVDTALNAVMPGAVPEDGVAWRAELKLDF
jgi:hypothetical protein